MRCSGSLLDYESAFEPVGLSLEHPSIQLSVSGSARALQGFLFCLLVHLGERDGGGRKPESSGRIMAANPQGCFPF